MKPPLVAELAEAGIPVAVSCRVLKLARQPYYRWAARPVGPAAQLRAHRVAALTTAHLDDPTAGYRVLASDRVATVLDQRVVVLLRQPKNGKKRKKGVLPAHEDRVRRLFTAIEPNRLWLMDIAEHKTPERKLYSCAIEDVYCNRIVGYFIQSRMKSRIVVDAIEHAVARRQMEDADVAGCIRPSGRGSQLRAPAARQRRDGVVLLDPATQGPRHPSHLTGPPRPTAGDRDLDRTRLPPTTTPRPPGPIDPRRIRNQDDRCLTHP